MQKFSLFQNLSKGSFRSKAEEVFCQQWVEDRWLQVLRSSLVVGTFVNLLAIIFLRYFTSVEISSLFSPLHEYLLLGQFCSLAAWKNPKIFLRLGSVVIVGFLTAYQLSVYKVILVDNPMQHVSIWVALISASIFSIQFLPTVGIYAFIQASVFIGASYLTLHDQPFGLINVGFFAVILYFTCFLKQRSYVASVLKAQNEFRFRNMIAPSHIVRRASRRGESLSQAFAPEYHFCACISSDWRNYQQLSNSISGKHLAAALEAYYALCNRLLEKVIPNGNFFVDWIADELFVVIFETKQVDHEEVVRSALRFSAKLVHAKEHFYEKFGLPAHIDIGVSCGEAMIGLMGPKAHKKATALGDVPGRARRIQNFGKILKQKLGQTDRIIFDQKVFALAPHSLKGIRTYAMGSSDEIRDVKCDHVFFLDPMMGKTQAKKKEIQTDERKVRRA